MKKTILFLGILTGLAGVAICLVIAHGKPLEPKAVATATENDAAPAVNPGAQLVERPRAIPAIAERITPRAAAPVDPKKAAYRTAMDTLLSPTSTYAQRQMALDQLKEQGRLRDAVNELDQLKAQDPNNALYPTLQGQAYLRLCSTTTDVREQAILAMTADQDFDAALNLDPNEWDARFTKAVGMSYWPEGLNKGDEVIQNLNTLIAQQEQQVPQPQFVQTYAWLGKQYQKAGNLGAAQQAWQQGLAVFPNNPVLQNLMAASASADQ